MSKCVHPSQGLLTMVAFWAYIPPQPDQLCKLQIIACLELAAITAFAVAYLLQLWRHYREVQPDAERYLAASWLPVHGQDYSRHGALSFFPPYFLTKVALLICANVVSPRVTMKTVPAMARVWVMPELG